MKQIFLLIGIGCLLYLFLLMMLFYYQDSLIYFPDKKLIMSPETLSLPCENVLMQTKDSVILNGWFFNKANSDKVILFFHGNAGNISHRFESIQIFYKMGLSVFIIDYRGYGKSEGSPSEAGIYIDAQTAWDYLIKNKKFTPDKIIIFGRSLGAAVAVRLASTQQPTGLILESAFISVAQLGSEIYPVFPIRLLTKNRYNNIEYIKKVHSPLLLIHSEDDEIIPYHHGVKLFKAANEPKKMVTLHGDHNSGFLTSGGVYESEIKTFISGLK